VIWGTDLTGRNISQNASQIKNFEVRGFMGNFLLADIARHVGVIHRLAEGQTGKLVLAAFNENAPPAVFHFPIGNTVATIEAVANLARQFENVPGTNLFMPLAVFRPDLPEGAKGSEADILAVLGAVVDSDADKGNAARPPVEADYTLCTSPGNFQYFLFFDKPLARDEAKPLSRALKRSTGADCADDLSHVWRVPGALNHPGAAKLKRGRSPEPFQVSVVRQWDGTSRTSVERLRSVLAPHFEAEHVPETTAVSIGERDAGDVAGMVHWLTDAGAFEAYEDWVSIGMALKLEMGADAGLDIWRLTFNGTVTPEVEATKWRSFSTDTKSNSVTLNTWMRRAHELGWKGQIRRSISAMFEGVNLSPATPLSSSMPMLQGQKILSDIAAPTLGDFLRNTADVPAPRSEYPTLPEVMAWHVLYEPLRASITRIIAMTENGPKLFKLFATAVIDPLAVLQIVHADTFEAVRRRMASFGCELQDRKVKHAATALADRVGRNLKTDDWSRDVKGQIESDNSDNVLVFLGVIGAEVRWNAWKERAEIRGGNDPELRWLDWTYLDDAVIAKLRTRATRSGTRFKPAREFLWEVLLDTALKNSTDPVIDKIAELEAAWDGRSRLDSWLSQVVGVADDAYHRAVGRNIIGGIVRRARHPGCKHDTMAVLFGAQGTGKSTLASLLALDSAWFSESIQLGEAAKELVLSLAGKLVVEISEMSARNSANASGIKAMVSRQTDEGRTAYARAVSTRGRRNIFLGTTNDSEPLSDPSGNRRFMPVRCDQEINLDWLRENICHLVGETAALETQGNDFSIPREVWALAAEHAEAARSESDTETLLANWFGDGAVVGSAYIVGADLVELCRMAGLRGGNAYRSAIMQRLGFRRDRAHVAGKQTWIWLRGPDSVAIEHAARFTTATDVHGRPRVVVHVASASIAPSSMMPPVPVR
jgi:hypothetical protein